MLTWTATIWLQIWNRAGPLNNILTSSAGWDRIYHVPNHQLIGNTIDANLEIICEANTKHCFYFHRANSSGMKYTTTSNNTRATWPFSDHGQWLPSRVISCHVMSRYVMPQYVTSCYTMYLVTCYVILCYVVSCVGRYGRSLSSPVQCGVPNEHFQIVAGKYSSSSTPFSSVISFYEWACQVGKLKWSEEKNLSSFENCWLLLKWIAFIIGDNVTN